jgi:hypothetical protein
VPYLDRTLGRKVRSGATIARDFIARWRITRSRPRLFAVTPTRCPCRHTAAQSKVDPPPLARRAPRGERGGINREVPRSEADIPPRRRPAVEKNAADRIGVLLAGLGGPSAFASKRTAPAHDLHLEVRGVGPLRLPLSRAQAERLCSVARPARYGQGERTLLDKEVRDTWEVPKSRVKVDKQRWNQTLRPMLDRVRADLGLPDGPRLRAEFHGMLVYGPGQFFRRHKDSEKSDDMVATLAVTLPSSFRGGSLVIEHGGETVTSRGSKSRLSFVAFYADCPHEVRPVTEGYRVSLTYNLVLEGPGTGAGGGAAKDEIVDAAMAGALADLLGDHLTTRIPRRYRRPGDDPLREPPERLVFLLDHQYTERGLAWHRLKGEDAARAAALRAAAEGADCEAALALAEIHEQRECLADDWGWDTGWYGGGRGRRWERDEDDEWYEDEPPPDGDPDRYPLGDLLDGSVTLNRWIAPTGRKSQDIHTTVSIEELCYATPTTDLEPYASEYEGYMGNYGNTMDRWYRRAAVVLWAKERAFVVRAEASPSWALGTLKKRIRAGEIPGAREMAHSLVPFWGSAARSDGRRGLFGHAMVVAEGVDEPELAAALLEPFPVEALIPSGAPALVALLERYGEAWLRPMLSTWSRDRWVGSLGQDGVKWLATLPRVAGALCEADVVAGSAAARMLLEDRWAWLRERIEETRGLVPPSWRDETFEAWGDPLLAFLEAAARSDAGGVLDEAVGFLLKDENEPLLPCLMRVIRAAASSDSVTPETWDACRLGTLRAHCVGLLETRLATPARADGDWSLDPPGDCTCEDCATLAGFLTAPDRTRLELPLAKPRRQHIHQALDRHGLPVRHETRRSGRPYTLVLTKTAGIFQREAAWRRSWLDDLAWLEELDARPSHAESP